MSGEVKDWILLIFFISPVGIMVWLFLVYVIVKMWGEIRK